MEAREKVAELKGKLRLKEDIVKELNSAHLNSRARSPSVMPKEERVAVVDAMMEVVGVRNEIAAQALFMKRLSEQNGELKKKITDLEEENRDLKQEIEKRRFQAVSKVEENEKGRTEVKDLLPEKPGDEDRRAELQVRTSTSQRKEQGGTKVNDAISKSQKKRKRSEEIRDLRNVLDLKALTLARSKVEQARDPSEIFGALNMSTSKKMASLVRKGYYPLSCGLSSDKVGIF